MVIFRRKSADEIGFLLYVVLKKSESDVSLGMCFYYAGCFVL
jgi:hypothetical protein